eukprot:scaffold117914_cov36-Tisochrysis_lutea.AAC.4
MDSGLLMCAAGGSLHGPSAVVNMHAHFKLTLSVELYFTAGEMEQQRTHAQEWEAKVRARGIQVSVHQVEKQVLQNRFNCKVASILQTRLSQIIFVDSDVLFLQSPQVLFQTREYSETGLMLFRDRQFMWNFSPNSQSPFFELLHQSLKNASTQLQTSNVWRRKSNNHAESGIIVLDRKRHTKTLAMLAMKAEIWQNYVHGDKEMFWMAAEFAETPYAFSPYAAGQLHTAIGALQCCGLTVHFHPDHGSALAIHGLKNMKDSEILYNDNTLSYTAPSRDVYRIWGLCSKRDFSCPSCRILHSVWSCNTSSLLNFSTAERNMLMLHASPRQQDVDTG